MDNETAVLPDVPAEIKEAARQAGGGWLDEVVGTWRQVPMRAIKGSWRLDENGEPTGEYVANEDFDPTPPKRSGCPMGYS